MGGRPIKSGVPRQRKSIAFLGEAVEVMESIAVESDISYADVLHVALIRLAQVKGIDSEKFVDALKDKANSLESTPLINEINNALA